MSDQPGCSCSICDDEYANRIPAQSDLRNRLVLAVVNTLVDGDPVLMIGVGDNDIRPGWGHTIASIRSAEKLGLTGDGE